MRSNCYKKIFVCAGLIFSLAAGESVFAQNVTDLKNKIENHTEEIKKLDEEIKKYQGQIEATGREANTLQSAIKTLDLNQQKITTEIKKTETNISKTNLTLQELSSEISTTEEKIELGKKAIALSLRAVRETDAISLVEVMLGNNSLADAFDQYQKSENLNTELGLHGKELAEYKADVEIKHGETEKKKGELVHFNEDLRDQNSVLVSNKKEKNSLLTETKNKEAEYKKILAQKQAQKEQFEKELFDFESQLKIAIDPSKYQSAKKGVLAWPLENIFITQQFGKTADARRLYTSGSHNGIDLRATRGTKIMSILDGTVKATGNTDAQAGCYSYGKWILIDHPNGLSSLYAHLDVIRVSAGQTVATGDTIGYSGATGYATGPHLHLTLYASQGVRVERYTSSRNCKNVDIPTAPANAYLDPLPYFPPL